MVVVAIIALLVGILLPALRSARAQTRRVACAANLHNLGMAWRYYIDAQKGELPRVGESEPSAEFPTGPQLIGTTYGGKQGKELEYQGERLLNPYLKLPKVVTSQTPGIDVFHCQGDRGDFIRTPKSETIYSTHFDYYGTSYRTNRFLIGPKPPIASWNDPCWTLINNLRDRLDRLNVNQVTAPESRLILMGDYGFDDWQNPSQNDMPVEFHADSYDARDEQYDPVAGSRHDIAYMDGHVEFVDIRKGLHVTGRYTMIPFRDMQQPFAEDQKPGNFPQ